MSGRADENVADVIAAAKEKFDVIITDGHILLIDIDSKSQTHTSTHCSLSPRPRSVQLLNLVSPIALDTCWHAT